MDGSELENCFNQNVHDFEAFQLIFGVTLTVVN